MNLPVRIRPGVPGFIYLFITLLLAVGAVNSQNNLLFFAFGIALSAGIVSIVLGVAMMRGLHATRSTPMFASAGSPATIRYRIRNRRRRLPAFAIRITEAAPPKPRPPRRTRAWTDLLPPPRAALLHLGPGRSAETSAVVAPRRRGVAEFTGIVVSSTFPFGLLRVEATIPQPASLPIAPRSERLRRDLASHLLTRADAGVTSTVLRGRGDEFYGLREYVPGDSPRHISWRSSARTGALVVREHARTTSGVLWILLNFNSPTTRSDAGITSAADSPDERAIVLAASLIVSPSAEGIDVGLDVPSAGLRIPPGPASRQRRTLLEALARLDVGRHDPPAEFTRHLDAAPHRAACIVIHSGGIDPAAGPPGARHLSADDLPRLVVAPPREHAAKEAGA